MSDALTDHLVGRVRSESPFVLKYLPYGNLAEVSVCYFQVVVVRYLCFV